MANYSDEAIARLALIRRVPMTDSERDLITGLEPLMRSVLEFPCPRTIAEVFEVEESAIISRVSEIAICCQAVSHLKLISVTTGHDRYRQSQIEAGIRIYLDETQRLVTKAMGDNITFRARYHRRTQAFRLNLSQTTDVADLTDSRAVLATAKAYSGAFIVPLDVIYEFSTSRNQLKYEVLQQVLTLVQTAHALRRTEIDKKDINTIMSRVSRLSSHLAIPDLDTWLADNLETLNNHIS